ncbi:protein kinase [Geminocystis sp.]|uniref:protein kinase domain-containing protein n=1 Tax=Geminocystis sp. TaxID=2664100 RepID=UPI003593B743
MSLKILNRYEIIKQLSSSDFVETFLVKDRQMSPEKEVVLKCFYPSNLEQISPTIIENLFNQEASTLAKLGKNFHQIPIIYNYFQKDGKYYLVEEYIKGKNLTQLGIISSKQCVTILSSLLVTLKYFHHRNIIHQDIKPENIILRESDNKPVLINFGTFKEIISINSLLPNRDFQIDSVMTNPEEFTLYQKYMMRTSFLGNLYCLAVSMIYSLTGKLPMEIHHDANTQILEANTYLPNVNPSLAAILIKAIAMDTSIRYATANQMYDDLQTFLKTQNNYIPEKTTLSSVSDTDDNLVNSIASSKKNFSIIILAILITFMMSVFASLLITITEKKTPTIVETLPQYNTNKGYGKIGGMSNNISLYSENNTNSRIVGYGFTGQAIQILGSEYDKKGIIWYKVYHPESGVTGWIQKEFIDL